MPAYLPLLRQLRDQGKTVRRARCWGALGRRTFNDTWEWPEAMRGIGIRGWPKFGWQVAGLNDLPGLARGSGEGGQAGPGSPTGGGPRGPQSSQLSAVEAPCYNSLLYIVLHGFPS